MGLTKDMLFSSLSEGIEKHFPRNEGPRTLQLDDFTMEGISGFTGQVLTKEFSDMKAIWDNYDEIMVDFQDVRDYLEFQYNTRLWIFRKNHGLYLLAIPNVMLEVFSYTAKRQLYDFENCYYFLNEGEEAERTMERLNGMISEFEFLRQRINSTGYATEGIYEGSSKQAYGSVLSYLQKYHEVLRVCQDSTQLFTKEEKNCNEELLVQLEIILGLAIRT